MAIKICLVLLFCVGSVVSYKWTQPASQELFHSLISNITECRWVAEETPYGPNAFFNGKVNITYYGICAPNVDSCIHLGTTPHPVAYGYESPNCTVCCARRTCQSYPYGTTTYQRTGTCMLPELYPYNYYTNGNGVNGTGYDYNNSGYGFNNTGYGFNYTGFGYNYTGGNYYGYSGQVNFTRGPSFFSDPGFDSEDQMCQRFGGQVAQATGEFNNVSFWWDMQCPMSGRCCLFPEVSRCTTCGQKYGRTWNFSSQPAARSGDQDEALAWKTAVHQMAGTGWNLGMQPVVSPGFAEQYSQVPPNYDSLLSPQLWNSGLNFLNGNKDETKKGDDDNDDNDEDDYKGWCWQATILSKTTGNLRCGAALISDRYLLTTAACANFTDGSFFDYRVRFGSTDLRKVNEKHAVDLEISNVYIHPYYDASNFDNNIAIFELSTAVPCDGKYVCTICLPTPFIMHFGNFTFATGHEQSIRDDVQQCLVTGFGRRTTGNVVSYLKEIPYTPIYHNDTFCETNMRLTKGFAPDYTLPNNTFCAAPQPTTRGKVVSACHGDAGGPLACFYGGRFYLTGLLSSFNNQRCESTGKVGNIVAKLQPNRFTENYPLVLDVFTDVSQFIPWINTVIYGFF